LKHLRISNRLFFYPIGFSADCFNYIAVLGEVLLANGRFHATEWQLGLLGFFSALSYAVFCPLTGYLCDHSNKRVFAICSVAGVALSFYLSPRVPTLSLLIEVSVFRSACISLMWPPLMAWMTETCRSGGLSFHLGSYNISWALGILSGYFISGSLYERFGGNAPFNFSLCYALLLLVFLIIFSPAEIVGRQEDHGFHPQDVRFFIGQGMLMVTLGCFSAGLVLYVFPKIAQGTMRESLQGLLHSARMAGQVIAFILCTHTSIWHFRMWTPAVSLIAFAAGLALIWHASGILAFVPGFMLVGFGMGVAYSMSIYYTLFLAENKGMSGGIQEMLIGLGNLLGPLYGGTLAYASTPRLAMLMGIVPLVCAAPFCFLRFRHENSARSSG
jgi:MFS family permease